MYLTSSPFWLQWLYPGLTWHRSRSQKEVYLTFDDGPIPVVTPFVLKTLKKFGIKATFFCIGDNVQRHPDIYANILADGHRTGNHTLSHLRGWDHPTETYLDNLEKCEKLVRSNLFRPPYGRISRAQIAAIKSRHPEMEIVMWDVLSGDFDERIDSATCVRNVIKNAKNGSIIVFHDSQKAFPRLEEALPSVIEKLLKKGFSFKAL